MHFFYSVDESFFNLHFFTIYTFFVTTVQLKYTQLQCLKMFLFYVQQSADCISY
jgi:hypothetical protein